MFFCYADNMKENTLALIAEKWNARWHLVEDPGKDFILACPTSWLPPRAPGSQSVEGREELVDWLLIDINKVVYFSRAPGSSSADYHSAVENALMVSPNLSQTQNNISMTRPCGLLPYEGGIGVIGSTRIDTSVKNIIREEGTKLYNRFRSYLDQEVLSTAQGILRAVQVPSANSYNLLIGTQATSKDMSTTGLWRRQLVETWPLLSKVVLGSETIIKAVDNGEKLLPVIVEKTQLKKTTIKALMGPVFGLEATSAKSTLVRPKKLHYALLLADAAPSDWLPKSPQEWKSCLGLATRIHDAGVLDGAWSIPGLTVGEVLPTPAKREYLSALMRRNGPDWGHACLPEVNPELEDEQTRALRQRLMQGANHINDTCRALALEIILPLAWQAERYQEVYIGNMHKISAEALFSHRSPRQAFLASWRHLEFTRNAAMLLNAPMGNGFQDEAVGADANENPEVLGDTMLVKHRLKEWEALAPDAITPDGYQIINLVDGNSLTEEGHKMKHCVGGYRWMCIQGFCSIFSIRDPEGNRISTAEIRLSKRIDTRDNGIISDMSQSEESALWQEKKINISLAQHRAKSNQAPSREAVKAIVWYVDNLRTKEIELNQARVSDMLENHSNQQSMYNHAYNYYNQRLHEQMGVEYNQPEALQARWRRWKRHLDVKYATPQEWMQSLPAILRDISAHPVFFTDAMGKL